MKIAILFLLMSSGFAAQFDETIIEVGHQEFGTYVSELFSDGGYWYFSSSISRVNSRGEVYKFKDIKNYYPTFLKINDHQVMLLSLDWTFAWIIDQNRSVKKLETGLKQKENILYLDNLVVIGENRVYFNTVKRGTYVDSSQSAFVLYINEKDIKVTEIFHSPLEDENHPDFKREDAPSLFPPLFVKENQKLYFVHSYFDRDTSHGEMKYELIDISFLEHQQINLQKRELSDWFHAPHFLVTSQFLLLYDYSRIDTLSFKDNKITTHLKKKEQSSETIIPMSLKRDQAITVLHVQDHPRQDFYAPTKVLSLPLENETLIDQNYEILFSTYSHKATQLSDNLVSFNDAQGLVFIGEIQGQNILISGLKPKDYPVKLFVNAPLLIAEKFVVLTETFGDHSVLRVFDLIEQNFVLEKTYNSSLINRVTKTKDGFAVGPRGDKIYLYKLK